MNRSPFTFLMNADSQKLMNSFHDPDPECKPVGTQHQRSDGEFLFHRERWKRIQVPRQEINRKLFQLHPDRKAGSQRDDLTPIAPCNGCATAHSVLPRFRSVGKTQPLDVQANQRRRTNDGERDEK